MNFRTCSRASNGNRKRRNSARIVTTRFNYETFIRLVCYLSGEVYCSCDFGSESAFTVSRPRISSNARQKACLRSSSNSRRFSKPTLNRRRPNGTNGSMVPGSSTEYLCSMSDSNPPRDVAHVQIYQLVANVLQNATSCSTRTFFSSVFKPRKS